MPVYTSPLRSPFARSALLLGALLLGACGGSDDDPGVDGASPDASAGPAASTDDPQAGGTGGTPEPAAGAPGATDGDDVDSSAPDATAGSGLPDDVADRLERVLSLYNGDPVEVAAALVERFDAPGSGVVETARTAEPAEEPTRAETVEHACANGGTVRSVETSYVSSTPSGRTLDRRIAFDGCRVGAFEVDGETRVEEGFAPEGAFPPAPYARETLPQLHSIERLRYTDARSGDSAELGGQVSWVFPVAPADGADFRINWSATGTGAPLAIVDARGTTLVENLATGLDHFEGGQPAVRQSSLEATIAGDGAEGLAGYRTLEAFARDAADGPFTSGVLEVSGQGFVYTLDAANGDPASFQLTVEADGSSVAYTVPWSERFDLEAFEPSSVDLGF